MASVIILPFGFKNRVYIDILGYLLVLSLGSNKEFILLVVIPCSNFLASGPCTIIIYLFYSLAKYG